MELDKVVPIVVKQMQNLKENKNSCLGMSPMIHKIKIKFMTKDYRLTP